MGTTSIPTEGSTLISCQSGVDPAPALAHGFAHVDVTNADDPFSIGSRRDHDRIVFVVSPATCIPTESLADFGVPTFVVASPPVDEVSDLFAQVAALAVRQEDLRRENARLNRELDKTVAERADAAEVRRRYDSLRNSTLGKATMRYWDLRRQLKRRSS